MSRFEMRLTDEELAWLDQVARHHGLGRAATVRMLVKRELNAMAAQVPPSTSCCTDTFDETWRKEP